MVRTPLKEADVLKPADSANTPLLSGLKKELWQYHLNELKNDTFKYQKSEKAKGAIVVKGQ